jgi:hypothetical protein
VLNPIAEGQRSRELVRSGRRLDRHSSSPAAPAGVAADVAETGRAATAWYGSRQNPLRARSPCDQAADLVSPRRGNWSQRRRPASAERQQIRSRGDFRQQAVSQVAVTFGLSRARAAGPGARWCRGHTDDRGSKFQDATRADSAVRQRGA